jgi:HD-like signal output (HDOD) protein
MARSTTRSIEILERAAAALPLPPAAAAIVELAAHERSSSRELAAACEADLSLAARLLALVNSKVLGWRQPISSLLQAAAILGVQRVRNFVLAAYLTDHFQGLEAQLDVARYWAHAFTSAAIAGGMGQRASSPCSEDMFLAGLLHDTGIPLLAGLLPEVYPQLVARAAARSIPLSALEQEVLGIDHAEAAAAAIAGWGVPAAVLEAVSSHARDRLPAGAGPEAQSIWEALVNANRACRHRGWGLTETIVPWPEAEELPAWYPGSRERLLEAAGAHSRDAEEMRRLLALLPGSGTGPGAVRPLA